MIILDVVDVDGGFSLEYVGMEETGAVVSMPNPLGLALLPDEIQSGGGDLNAPLPKLGDVALHGLAGWISVKLNLGVGQGSLGA